MADENPRLSPLVRVFAIVVIAVLLVGTSLLVAPQLVGARWPWPIKPFTQRFLGAFYLAEMVAIVQLAWINRWSPGRLILIVAACFTVIVTLVSLWHLDQFNFGRRGSWGWFILYAGSAAISLFALWHYSRLPHPKQPPSPEWRRFFVVETIVLGVYGLALLLAPNAATSFWPWTVQSFDAQIYSAIFFTSALGAYVASRGAASEELVALGLGQLVLGLAAILGLFLADSVAHSVHWTSLATAIWILLFLAVSGFGLNALVLARASRRAG